MPQRVIPRPPGTPERHSDPLAATGPPLRWGVVATGTIARNVTPQLARLEDARLHAVSSRSRERAESFAAEFGFVRAFGDDGVPGYQQLMEDDEVDVVYVTTPHGQHFEVTRAALEAGKHVLVEKSFTVTAREAEALIDLSRDRGVFLMEAVWTRFLPAFQRALDVIAAGEIGEVRWLQADIGFVAARDPRSRFWVPADGGGALLDLTVYPLTWAIGALGFPATVVAVGSLTRDGVDAQNALTLGYDGGAQAQLLSTLVSVATRTTTIAGDEGVLRVGTPLTRPTLLQVQRGDDVRDERFEGGAPLYAYQLREVTRCVQQGLAESPTMRLADTLATMRLFDEARRQLGVVYPHDDER